jgi:integrase
MVHVDEVSRLISANPSSFGLIKGAPTGQRVLLNRMVEEIGLMPVAAIREAVDEGVLSIIPKSEPDPIYAELVRWSLELRKRGIGVPGRGADSSRPCFASVARFTGLDAKRLGDPAYPYRDFLVRLGADVGYVATPKYGPAQGVDVRHQHSINAEDQKLTKLSGYLSIAHVGPKVPLPESVYRRGTPDYKLVCSNAGVNWTGLHHPRSAGIIRLLNETSAFLGVGPDAYISRTFLSISYQELLEIGGARFRLEMSPAKTVAARFDSALRTWRKDLGKSPSDLVRDDFNESFDQRVNEAAGSLQNVKTKRRWLANMFRWREYALDLLQAPNDELPKSFQGALHALLRRQEPPTSLRPLVRKVGLEAHYAAIAGWLSKGSEPLLTDQSVVTRLETALGARIGTLSERIRRYATAVNLRVGFWPPSLNDPLLRKLAKPILPHNFAYLEEHVREEIGKTIAEEARGHIAYRLHLEKCAKWRLRPFPEPLNQELQELIDYKTALLPRHLRGSTWAENTVSHNLEKLRTFFSALALSKSRGGLGIPTSDLTLALCACPEVIRWYVEWEDKRGREGLNTGMRAWIGVLAHLSTADTKTKSRQGSGIKGYLHFRPELAQRLSPIAGIVSEDEVKGLQSPEGWSAGLAAFSDYCWAIFSMCQQNLTFSRDPFEPILPILNSPRPMDYLTAMLQRAFDDLPDQRRCGPYHRAIAVRRYVTMLIAVRTALRRKNVGGLTWLPNNEGKLQRADNHWRIVVPVKEFKNASSSFFGGRPGEGRARAPYVRELRKEDTAIIDEYINHARPLLLANSANRTDAVFLSKSGERLQDSEITNTMYHFSWRYLVHHESMPGGIKGVEVFGVHAIRDITATHILKTTHNLSLAADAIQDTPEMVLKHYGHYFSQDRNKGVQAFFDSDLASGGWDNVAAANG